MRMVLVLTVVGTAAAVSGCGRGWKAETHPVAGRVTVNGRPPVGAIVHLYTTSGSVDVRNSRPWGVVKDDGSFTLSTYEVGDGAPAGEYVFTITWPFKPGMPDPSDRLGFAYATPEKSKRPVKVSPGDNQLPPVELTNVAVATAPPTTGGAPMKGGR